MSSPERCVCCGEIFVAAKDHAWWCAGRECLTQEQVRDEQERYAEAERRADGLPSSRGLVQQMLDHNARLAKLVAGRRKEEGDPS